MLLCFIWCECCFACVGGSRKKKKAKKAKKGKKGGKGDGKNALRNLPSCQCFDSGRCCFVVCPLRLTSSRFASVCIVTRRSVPISFSFALVSLFVQRNTPLLVLILHEHQ